MNINIAFRAAIILYHYRKRVIYKFIVSEFIKKIKRINKLSAAIISGDEKYIIEYCSQYYYKNYVPDKFIELIKFALYYSKKTILIKLLECLSARAIVVYFADRKIFYYAPHDAGKLRLTAIKLRNFAAYKALLKPNYKEIIIADKTGSINLIAAFL